MNASATCHPRLARRRRPAFAPPVSWAEMVSHRSYLVRFAQRKLRDPMLAEDAVHDVFEAVLSGACGLQPRPPGLFLGLVPPAPPPGAPQPAFPCGARTGAPPGPSTTPPPPPGRPAAPGPPRRAGTPAGAGAPPPPRGRLTPRPAAGRGRGRVGAPEDARAGGSSRGPRPQRAPPVLPLAPPQGTGAVAGGGGH